MEEERRFFREGSAAREGRKREGKEDWFGGLIRVNRDM